MLLFVADKVAVSVAVIVFVSVHVTLGVTVEDGELVWVIVDVAV